MTGSFLRCSGASIGRAGVGTVEAERRKRTPADKLVERQAWRDRRLMALAAHKRRADKDIGR